MWSYAFPNGIHPEQLDWTVELVSKRDGGFAMIGGFTSFGSGGWDPDILGRYHPGRANWPCPLELNGPFRVVIPPKAALHPIWKIVDDPARNRDVLAQLPVFYGTNLTDRLKPAATALGLSDLHPAPRS